MDQSSAENSLPMPDQSHGSFPTTQWSVVLAAGHTDSPQAAHALEKLARTYWYPLYAFLRRRGESPQDAEDLTQSFFVHLLAHDVFRQVGREKGKFRSFLLAALSNFLRNDFDKRSAKKRGGTCDIIS